MRAGTAFDGWTSFVVTLGYAIPGFLFAVLLVVLFAGGNFWNIFPSRGLTSDNWYELSLLGKVGDYFWHIALPVTAMVIGAFANLTMLTKNSVLDEINKQYVLTARAKGLSERGVLYGHVFRNAMLIVIAGFPAAFVSVLFSSSLLIEVIFSLDGLGLLGFEATLNRDFPLMLGSLFFFSLLGLLTRSAWRHLLRAGRSAHRFRAAGHMSRFRPGSGCGPDARDTTGRPAPLDEPAHPPPLGELQGAPARLWDLWIFALPIRRVAARRAHRQRPADPHGGLSRQRLHAGLRQLSRDRIRRRIRDRGGLSRSGGAGR